MDSSSVSHFSLSTSDFSGTLDSLNISNSVEGGEKLDCSRGLFEGSDGLVRNNEGNLWNSGNPVATSKHKGSGC